MKQIIFLMGEKISLWRIPAEIFGARFHPSIFCQFLRLSEVEKQNVGKYNIKHTFQSCEFY